MKLVKLLKSVAAPGRMLLAVCIASLLAGGGEARGDEVKKLKVTTTIGMVADLVKQVGGDRVAVDALFGPGVDPHLYKPTASDVTRLSRADVIF